MSKPGTAGRWNREEHYRYSASRMIEHVSCDRRRGRQTENLAEPVYIERVAQEPPGWHKGARVRRSHPLNQPI